MLEGNVRWISTAIFLTNGMNSLMFTDVPVDGVSYCSSAYCGGTVGLVGDYFHSMGVADDLADAMFSVPNGSVRILRQDELSQRISLTIQKGEWRVGCCLTSVSATGN